jgi:hypothetical protein
MGRILITSVAVCCIAVESIKAQEPASAGALFSRAALLRALPPDTSYRVGQLDPRTNWARVRELRAPVEIFLTAADGSTRRYRFVSADDVSVTVVDPEGSGRQGVRIARSDVAQVRQIVGHQGSVAGAALGAGGGLALGFFTATMIAYKPCGVSCDGEGFLMGLSLVGMPIGGAVLGYSLLPGGHRDFSTIYLKP